MSEGKLNILFVGNLRGTSTSIFYYQQLIQMGHVLYPFEPRYYDNLTALDKVSLKLKKRPRLKSIQSVNQQLMRIVERNSFDIIFVFNENFFDLDFIERLRKKSKKSPVLIYHSHDNLFAKGVMAPTEFLKALAAFDYVFTTKSQNVEKYKKLGQERSFFIPAAFEPSIHRPISPEESRLENRAIDVSFVGTFDQSRLPVLEKVGFERMHVWGEGWQKYKNYKKFQKRIHARGIYFLEYSDVLSHSAISLGLLREEAEDKHTQRTFEIPACMSLQIAPRNSELQSLFKEDEEIVLFSSLEELNDKVNFYLNNPDSRLTICQNAFERIYTGKFTYFHRVLEILQISGFYRSTLTDRNLEKEAA